MIKRIIRWEAGGIQFAMATSSVAAIGRSLLMPS